MKRLPITLADGEHYISTPTFATLQLIEDMGLDVSDGLDLTKASVVNKLIAALLTSEEPLVNGVPQKQWTPLEAGQLIRPGDLESIVHVIAQVLRSAFSDVTDETADDKRPTRASRGAAKP